MADAQSKQPIGLGEIAVRPVTYAALAILAAGYLGLILWLHSQVTQDVSALGKELTSIRDILAKTREEAAEFRGEVRGEFKQLRTEMNGRFDRLEELIKAKQEK
jgi:sensor histidine kinase YesM